MKRKRVLAAVALLLAGLSLTWVSANAAGRFGWSCFALTTYDRFPFLSFDLQVRADGTHRTIEKTHSLEYEAVAWLLEPATEVLIVALGWNEVVQPSERIRSITACRVHLLPSGEAQELYNRLKDEGVRVAIHYHSTC